MYWGYILGGEESVGLYRGVTAFYPIQRNGTDTRGTRHVYCQALTQMQAGSAINNRSTYCPPQGSDQLLVGMQKAGNSLPAAAGLSKDPRPIKDQYHYMLCTLFPSISTQNQNIVFS